MNTIEIDGITYEILDEKTAEQREAEGYVNIARVMRENNQTRQMALKRKNGKTMYYANEFSSKLGLSYSKPFSIGKL